ncbi:MAG TPA: transketolase [Gammaproteobacteria bacterium]|nr:transketolase [Gammaproteobacteria bacterium]
MSTSAAAGATATPLRREFANAIRALAMDAVQAANSGHPGAPMGMADIAEVLWHDYLRHNPANPAWPNRDRFVLSNGHASMLLYALLHLSGYELPLEELKRFRQFGSKTPGHPEYGHAPGVETTTGPLGQGLANAVGMALAERMLAAQFNRDGHAIVDHHTYVFAGDGCLMEGISHEACSLAGTLGLGKLIVLYDDNRVSIDGDTAGWFTDDTAARFRAYGWQVIEKVDGHDAAAIAQALDAARANTAQPTLLCCRTVIGYGSPNKAGKSVAHGAPLGGDEVQAARAQLGWPHPPFEIPADVYAHWNARERGAALEAEWQRRYAAYASAHPELAAEFTRRTQGGLPGAWPSVAQATIAELQALGAANATRKSSQLALEKLGPVLPELVGGSADLSESNLTHWKGSRAVTREDASGNYVNYGVREFGMAAIMSGLALHGGFIPYGGTFLVFSDYARNAIRMAALMGLRAIYVLTHDSIGLGEDGPTHQPVEHATALRIIPNCSVWRPCDAAETAAAWVAAIERVNGPTALLLTRQGVPPQARSPAQLADIRRGGYVLLEPAGAPEAIVIATGSEVAVAVAAATALNARGRRLRVVSMPSANVFLSQPADYREAVLPTAVRRRIAIEAGGPDYWYRFVGLDGEVIGITSFGASAPAGRLFEAYGLTAQAVELRIDSYLRG